MFSGTADYNEAIIDCAKEGAYSCIWTLCGLATVVGRDIISVYPAVNGPNDAGALILNHVLSPRIRDYQLDTFRVFWTRTSSVQNGGLWTPNHFVPLLQVDATVPSSTAQDFTPTTSIEDSVTTAPESLIEDIITAIPVDELTVPDTQITDLETQDDEILEPSTTTADPEPQTADTMSHASEIPDFEPAQEMETHDSDIIDFQSADTRTQEMETGDSDIPEFEPAASTVPEQPRIVEAHKGGKRLVFNGFSYVKNRLNPKKNKM